MTIKNKPTTEIPTTKIRLIAAALVPTMLLTGVFSIYWLWTNVLPIYGRIYRNAPVIEVPYLAFGLLMAPPAIIITVIGSAIAVWTGKKTAPAPVSTATATHGLHLAARCPQAAL